MMEEALIKDISNYYFYYIIIYKFSKSLCIVSDNYLESIVFYLR